MSSRFPWRDTSEDIAKQGHPQWETPGGAQQKADKAEKNAKDYSDSKLSAHIGTGGSAHALAVPSGKAGFISGSDQAKLNGIKPGAEVNQNAFSKINGILASVKEDTLDIEAGVGITITPDPANKNVRITATGTSTPGPHGIEHAGDGTDPIPEATETVSGLMSAADKVELRETAKGLEEVTVQLADIAINVKQYGAKGDWNGATGTDDASVIQSVLDMCSNDGGGLVSLPDGRYFVATKITVPSNVTLAGWSLGSNVNNANVEIIGAASLPIVVELNGGVVSAQTSLRNISVTREPGAIPPGSIGVKVASTDYSSLVDVNIHQHAIGLEITGQLSCNAERVVIYSVTEAYTSLENTPQITFKDCSFGRNGGENGIGPAIDMIRILNGIDTLSFIRCQINPTITGVQNAIHFKGYNNPNGYFYFTSCHIENMHTIISSDSLTSVIPRVILLGCTVSNFVNNPFIDLDPATDVYEWNISSCIITGTTTFTKGSAVNITGNRFSGAVLLDMESANITGNTFNTGVTLKGVWENLVFANNVFDGPGQKIIDMSTGNKSIFGNSSGNGYINNNILPGDFLRVGSGLSFAIKRYTGTLDASGAVSIPHEIISGHHSIVIAQAFYKGGAGGEMRQMNINYIDGANVVISGGSVNAPYRLTLIFSDNKSEW
ncbi:glycosyl hydrolase family 28-related protein [Paenibacillus solani]|uniref:glycosyl hydrolase family 28-related protein n=1 Tax=Paenibacillus solani TaxID=1705565 RepID=UPI003D2CAA16